MGVLSRVFASSAVPAPAVFVEGDLIVAAVGASRYQSAISRVRGSGRWGDVRGDALAVLVPAPPDRDQLDAVTVEVDGECVGRLSRRDAIRYGPAIRRFAQNGQRMACEVKIAGGGHPGDQLQVLLHLPAPEQALQVAG